MKIWRKLPLGLAVADAVLAAGLTDSFAGNALGSGGELVAVDAAALLARRGLSSSRRLAAIATHRSGWRAGEPPPLWPNHASNPWLALTVVGVTATGAGLGGAAMVGSDDSIVVFGVTSIDGSEIAAAGTGSALACVELAGAGRSSLTSGAMSTAR